MAISVEGYGNITKGNAREIYTAWRRGEIELDTSQQKKCESFLTPQEMDEVEYDDTVTANRGKNAINTEGTEKNTTGNAVGTTIGNVLAVGVLAILAFVVDGFTALALGLGSIAAGLVQAGMAKVFDNAYKDRTAAKDEKDQSNSKLDSYSDALSSSMDMMNEDVETYNEQQDQLTKTVNTQASQGADLQMQYDTAMAMGDTNKAQQLREQMKALSETDNSDLEDGLKETGDAIEEYRAMNTESIGCAESGQTVANFLKEGKTMGALAMVNGGIDCAVGILCGLAALGIFPKCLFDTVAALTAKGAYSIAAGVFAAAGGLWIAKGNQELECNSAGGDMQGHVNDLNSMIGQQEQYTTDTESQYAESDEAAGEAKEAASEAAGEAVSGNKDSLLGKPKKEDEPTGAAA